MPETRVFAAAEPLSPARLHYPITVVGAGPTGLMLTNLLAAYGVEVLLVERNAATVGEPRAVSIDDESLRTIQAAGLADSVFAQVVRGYGSEYFRADGRVFLKVHPTDEPYGYPRRNAFRQPLLEEQLREGLARFPHVRARFSCELRSFAQQVDRVILTVTDSQGATEQIECDYLVACDGASSGVRLTLGITMYGRSFAERWLIVDLENSPAMSRETLVFCAPERPCIALPGPDDTRRFEFKLHPHEDAERMLQAETVNALLRSHGAAPDSRLRRKVVYTFHARMAERWRVGRVLLAGDAAHLSPPFAGQGMNSGIRDAHNLAWKLWAVTQGLLGPRLLDSYETERRGHVWQMIQLALRMGRIMGPGNKLSAWLTQSSLYALRHWPRLRDYFAQMKYKPKPRFKQGFLLQDRLPVRSSLVGRLLPQPPVRRREGAAVLLDEVLGGGFSLLGPVAQTRALQELASLPQWRGLTLKPVAIESPAAAVTAAGAVETLVDQTGVLQAMLARYPARALLIRPDRYVAAAIELADRERAARQVERLLAMMQGPTAAEAGDSSNGAARPYAHPRLMSGGSGGDG